METEVEIAILREQVAALREYDARQNGALLRMADSQESLARDVRAEMTRLNEKLDSIALRQSERNTSAVDGALSRAWSLVLMGGTVVVSLLLHFIK